MSLGISAAAWTAIGAIGSMAVSIYNGQQAAGEQKKAQQQAMANANAQAAQADQAMNAANQKKPDTSAILSAATQAGRMGASGTMLTGPQGISPDSLNLGKNTLLGS